MLKPETERSSVLPFLAEIRDRAGADLDRWNAVWSDRYFIGWTVVTGTHTEFLAQGILPPESSGKSDIFVATRDLRFEWAPVQAGRRPYSSTHEELQEAIGAMIYEYNRLAAGFQAQRAELAEPAYGEIAGFEDLAPEWQDLRSVLFHFSKRKGEDWDETIWRRFRRELGASRMRVLHGEAPSSKELEVGARLVTEGRHLALTSTSKKFRDTKRAKLLLEDLGAFISLLHRESRLQAQGVNAIKLNPHGYPIDASLSAIAALKGGRSSVRHDQRPDLKRLTELAVRYRFDPVYLFGDISFLAPHFAAAMAVGVAVRRGEYTPDADAHYGLLGLLNKNADRHLDTELVSARSWLRSVVQPELFAAATQNEPPPAIAPYIYRRHRDFVRGKGRAAKFSRKDEQ